MRNTEYKFKCMECDHIRYIVGNEDDAKEIFITRCPACREYTNIVECSTPSKIKPSKGWNINY